MTAKSSWTLGVGLWMIAGLLMLSAGIRDFVAPGFLTISRNHDTDGTWEVILGSIIVLLCLVAYLRQRSRPVAS